MARKEELHLKQQAISALDAAVARAVKELEHVGKALTNAETLLGDAAQDLRREKVRQINQVLERHGLV